MYENIDELIESLELLKSQGQGTLSYPKSILLLALEIKKLNQIIIGDQEIDIEPKILHSIDCECEECLKKWERINKGY